MARRVNRRPFLACGIIWAASGLLPGCGGKHESSVSGTVFLDDEALATGNVTFYPTQGGAAVYSRIEADGAYLLKTGATTGLKPGEYKVTVVATEIPPVVKGSTPPIGKLLTPAKYGQLEETDLAVTVGPGNNKVELHLKSQ